MNRSALLAVLVVAFAPLPCRAQLGNADQGGSSLWPPQRWTVKVELVGDRAVTGVLTLAALGIDCDLGHYEILPEKIKEVRFGEVGARHP